ncbi:hypothetical protein [Collimonas arenae]|nr:hypothetical protein [Collimonas arenae]
MPFVTMGDQKVAAKINDYLFIGQVGVMAPIQPGKFFSAAGSDRIAGMASQEFTISRNDGRILTIAFAAEGCGAYCEDYNTYHSFDIKTGRTLGADDLLTESGMRNLAQKMAKERQSQYRRQLVSLKKDLKAAQKEHKPDSQNTISDLNDRIALNTDCLGDVGNTESLPSAAAMLSTFRYFNYELAEQAFKLTAGRCSNHAMRALDDVGDVTLAIPYAELKPYLTGYGKALLLGEGSGAPKNNVYGQLLRGKMGSKIAITMVLYKESDNSVGGVYFYDKYRKPIKLSGRQSGDALELSEDAVQGSTDKATMHLAISGDRLRGQWTGKTELPVDLAP